MSYMYRSKPENLRFQPIPPFIFPLQSLPELNLRLIIGKYFLSFFMLFTQKIIYFSLNSFVFPNLANKTQNIIANFRGKILLSKERVGGLLLEKYTTLIQSFKKSVRECDLYRNFSCRTFYEYLIRYETLCLLMSFTNLCGKDKI